MSSSTQLSEFSIFNERIQTKFVHMIIEFGRMNECGSTLGFSLNLNWNLKLFHMKIVKISNHLAFRK